MDETSASAENAKISDGAEERGRRKIPRRILIPDIILAIVAVILILVSGFWRSGSVAELADGVSAAQGKIVSFTIGTNYGFYAERYSAVSNAATGRYLLSSLDGEPVTVLVSESEFTGAELMRLETLQRLSGRPPIVSTEISGRGYVRELTDEELAQAYKWFEANKSIFDGSGIDASDAADIIGTQVIVMDYIGNISLKMSGLLINLGALLLAMTLIVPVSFLLVVRKSEESVDIHDI